MKRQLMTSIMFCADDERRHTLAFGSVAQGWMLESCQRGLIRTMPNLMSGLSELERVSGVSASRFSVMPNPYMVVVDPKSFQIKARVKG